MDFEGIKYVILKPNNFNDEIEYPTVIFMHGAGTRGDNPKAIYKNPFFTENNILLSKAIIYAPLCDQDSWFDMFESIRRFARFVYEEKNTDKSRLYLVGASMGGYAVWQMLMSDPQLYAGAIPICGGGMYWNAARLKDLNIWAFHGKEDPIVLCDESIKMVESINKSGGNTKLTILDKCRHNSWTYVYENPEPFQWLLGCRRKNADITRSSKYASSEYFG